jgi:hypothetical protein
MDGLLVFKLVFSPIVVAMATWLSRKLGMKVGGWIVALPLTSGPISIFFYLQHGPQFTAQAAIGTLGGSAGTALFCLAYGLMARRAKWPLSLGVGLVTFFGITALLKELGLSVWPTLIFVAVAYAASRYFMPLPQQTLPPSTPPWWDIPLRMVLATTLILLITGTSNSLGPDWSGLLSPIPLLISLLTVFAHHFQGGEGAIRTLRGTLTGTFAFALFFLIVALTITSLSPWLVYGLAAVVSVGANTLLQFITD